MKCRACSAELNLQVIDLGTAPASNDYLSPEQLDQPEQWIPLRVLVCEQCWLVQTQDFTQPEALFSSGYAYFSSYSSTWLKHAEAYVNEVVAKFGLGAKSCVVEIAANDGYLLQYVAAKGIRCLGVEPTCSTAQAARAKGLDIREEFFGGTLGALLKDEGWGADLMVANNVLAHVPDINDFLQGFALLLKPNGIATFEFPHLLKLIEGRQFDTLYHEHYSYLSMTALEQIFRRNGLSIFDVTRLETHGGSLRVFAQLANNAVHERSCAVEDVLYAEKLAGVSTAVYYKTLAPAAEQIKHDLLRFLLQAKADGKRVVGYGAAAKGNTLLNFAGVRSDLICWIADANPHKAGQLMPGSRIPIVGPEQITLERPDYVLLLPWNLLHEVNEQLAEIRDWGGRMVVAVPELTVL